MTKREKQILTLSKHFLSTAPGCDKRLVFLSLMSRLKLQFLSPVLTQEERKIALAHLIYINECFEGLSKIKKANSSPTINVRCGKKQENSNERTSK